MANIGKVILLVLGILSVVFLISCVAGNNWTEITSRKFNSGLWKYCSYGKCWSRGDGFEKEMKTYLYAVRAFAILSVLFGIGGTLLAFLGFITDRVRDIYVSLVYLLAALCMVVGLVIFIGKVKRLPGGSLGWSYILGWVGVVTSGIGCIFGFFAKKF